MPNQKYRSKLEAKVAESLVDWKYESTTVKYSVPRTYTPDFTKGRVYIEVKGFFRVGDTQKYKAINKQLKSEGKVLVFVWSDAHKRIRKGAKLTNAKWCDKEGIVWFDLSEIKELKKWSKQYV